MNVIQPTEKEFATLPEGTQLVEFSPPNLPIYETVEPAIGAKLPTGQVMFFLAFEDHDEWKDFKKSRKLILLFPLGEVPIFSIGSMFKETGE